MPFQIGENTLRKGIIWCLALLFGAGFVAFNHWSDELDGTEALEYYIHLPAHFLYHDAGDYEKTLTAAAAHYKQITTPGERHFSPEPTPNGKRCLRRPVGVAILTAPFFILAHLFCFITGLYPADGFSEPYLLLAGLAPIFYVLLGFGFLFRVLRRYYDRKTSIVTLFTIALATNLYYFTGYHNFMSHGFLFALVALLLHRTILFWEQPNLKNAVWVGLLLGMITLTRLYGVAMLFIPLCWGMVSRRSLSDRALFLVRKWYLFAAAALSGALMLVPQIRYNKAVGGAWWYSYIFEKLDFAHVHILGSLFNYKDGWLLYAPVLVLALIGVFLLRRDAKDALVPVLIVLPLYACIGFFSKEYPLQIVDLCALAALPMAALFAVALRRKWSTLLLAAALAFFTGLNMLQLWQIKQGILWPSVENKAHFWSVFGKTRHTQNALIALESEEMQPGNPESLSLVKRLLEDNMEDSTGTQFTRELKHGGNFGLRMGDQEFGGTKATEPGVLQDAHPGDWIRASVWGYTKDSEKLRDILSQALLTVVLQGDQGKEYKYRQIHIANKIGNPDGSLWHSGDTDRWGEAVLYVKIPRGFPSNGVVKAYVWNPNRERIYIDDLSVELRRKP
jgi:hypothetical protein